MRETPAGKRIVVDLAELGQAKAAPIKLGQSIAVSGVCLTVVELPAPAAAGFDVVAQTLRQTTLGTKNTGDAVNLELSLCVGDALGGHFVQGHVEDISRVLRVEANPADWMVTFELPPACREAILPRGSVAIDGVSMTVAGVDGDCFRVAVIPATREKTTLGLLRGGEIVNIESDILTRTVVYCLARFGRGSFLPGTGPWEPEPTGTNP